MDNSIRLRSDTGILIAKFDKNLLPDFMKQGCYKMTDNKRSLQTTVFLVYTGIWLKSFSGKVTTLIYSRH